MTRIPRPHNSEVFRHTITIRERSVSALRQDQLTTELMPSNTVPGKTIYSAVGPQNSTVMKVSPLQQDMNDVPCAISVDVIIEQCWSCNYEYIFFSGKPCNTIIRTRQRFSTIT